MNWLKRNWDLCITVSFCCFAGWYAGGWIVVAFFLVGLAIGWTSSN